MKYLKKAWFVLLLIAILITPIISYGAQWEPISFTLAFNANTDDPVENLPPDIHYTVGETVTIPSQTPIRTGYTFSGWNTYSDGSGTLYGPGDTLIGPDQDNILYAQWEEDNNPTNVTIIIIIVAILLFVFIVSIILLLYYDDCNCDCTK